MRFDRYTTFLWPLFLNRGGQFLLRGAGECGSIVSGEFLDSFACEFVLDVEGFPGLVQVEFFVRDRFASRLVLCRGLTTMVVASRTRSVTAAAAARVTSGS